MADRTASKQRHVAAILVAVTVLAIASVGVTGAEVTVINGTVFEADDDGPTVEIVQNLTLDSPHDYTDAHMVDLAPYASFESNGTTNVTVESVDGAWTNLTTHNVSAGLTIEPTDRQNVTLEGENVSYVDVSAIDDSNRSSTELVYEADSALNVTLTELSVSENIELLAADGSVVQRVSTDENGTATAELPAGEKRLTVAIETSGGSSDSVEFDATDDSYTVVANETLSVTVDNGVLSSVSDPDDVSDVLSPTVEGEPANGSLTLATNGSFTYTPDDEFIGNDSFTYEVSDNDGGADTATVTITVTGRTNAGSEPMAIENESAIRQQMDIPENATPIAAERVTIPENETGPATANFTDTTSVASVQFRNDTSGNLSVVEYDEPTATHSDVPGSTLAAFQISGSPAVENTTATVRTRVSQTELRNIDVNGSDIRIAHRTDENWELLNTTVVSQDDGSVRLEATADGFSPFAVTAVDTPNAAVSTPTTVTAGEELTLDGTDSTTPYGDIVSYEWTVDGQSLTSETTTLTLKEPGEYTIELTVMNDAGRTATTTLNVEAQSANDTTTPPTESTPTESTPATEETLTGTSGPGFDLAIALVALVAFVALALVVRRRRQ